MTDLVASIVDFVNLIDLAAKFNEDIVEVFLIVVALRPVMIVILLSKVEE